MPNSTAFAFSPISPSLRNIDTNIATYDDKMRDGWGLKSELNFLGLRFCNRLFDFVSILNSNRFKFSR